MSKNNSSDFHIFFRILKLAKSYKSLMVLTLVLAVLLAVLKTASPYIINLLVDHFVANDSMDIIIQLVGLYVAILVVQVGFQYGFIYSSQFIGQNVVNNLRQNLYAHLLGFRMRYFDTTRVGVNSTRVINDIETISTVFTQQGVMVMIADVLGIVAILFVMFITSVKLTLICLLTTPILLWGTYLFKNKVKSAFEVVRKEVAELNAFLQEHLSGMKIVQIFRSEKREADKFKKINRSYTQANIHTIKYYAIFFPFVEVMSALTLALIVWWGAKDLIHEEITLGALVAFPMYINRLFRPIRFLADKFNAIQMAMIAARRVFDLIDQPLKEESDSHKLRKKLSGKVEFLNLGFSYDDKNFVLKDINFKLEPGQTLALVGATGSGKSSIINVLSKLYDFQKGDVLLDNVSIRNIDKKELRSKIAIVLQDVFLFTGTVMENIRLRDDRITDDKIIEAARFIGIHDYIMQFPDGYNFILEERGANLSVGQRQLIAFVRALVFDPDILILDEATSSIDVLTEKIIQEAIQRLTKDRTAIIIAHRLSTIKHADNIIVMEKGKIMEQGNLEELMSLSSGHFKELYEMQFAE